MEQLTEMARPAAEKLVSAEENNLYEQLGIRLAAMRKDPMTTASFTPAVTYDAPDMGTIDTVREAGRIFFNDLNKDCYALVCGTKSENNEERSKLISAFGIGKTEVAAVLTGLLVAHLAMAPGIAAVVAALIVRLFFRNAHQAMCEVWEKKLPADAKS